MGEDKVRKLTRTAAVMELVLWALFVASQGLAVPAVNWLAIRGAIVWLKETPCP